MKSMVNIHMQGVSNSNRIDDCLLIDYWHRSRESHIERSDFAIWETGERIWRRRKHLGFCFHLDMDFKSDNWFKIHRFPSFLFKTLRLDKPLISSNLLAMLNNNDSSNFLPIKLTPNGREFSNVNGRVIEGNPAKLPRAS